MKHPMTSITALSILGCTSFAASAETKIGLGAIIAPQFEGSREFTTTVAPSFSFENEKFAIRSVGPGVEADLLSSLAVDAGPILRYNFGRTGAGIDNAQVSALPDIKGGVEFGGYAQVNFPLGSDFTTFMAPRVSIVQGVQGGASGTQIEAAIGLLHLAGEWTLGARVSTTYADAQYTNTYFGVDAGSASGLSEFSGGAGIKDASLTMFASYQVTEQVSLTGVAGYKVLTGDAAKSPIVSIAGTDQQMFLSLGVSYGF